MIFIWKLEIDFIVEGANRHADKGMDKYVEYINHLYKVYKELNFYLQK